MADKPIFIDLAALAGVDGDTYRRADEGDRQAQKVMLRSMLTQEASAAALTTGHWTDWMLRMIATGSTQATSDALGAIAEAARQRRISSNQLAALNELFEQYFGPGVAGRATVRKAQSAFVGREPETTVLNLFMLADRLASGDPTVHPFEVWEAAEEAAALKSPGAQSFFKAVWSQMTCHDDPTSAFKAGWDALVGLERLARNDKEYQVKVGQLAILVSQISEIGGDQITATIVRTLHADAIAQFRASEQ